MVAVKELSEAFQRKIYEEAATLFDGEPVWFHDDSTVAAIGAIGSEHWLILWTDISVTVKWLFMIQEIPDGRTIPMTYHGWLELKFGYGATALPESWHRQNLQRTSLVLRAIK